MKTRDADPTKTPEELLQDLRTLVNEAEAMLSHSVKEHSAEAIAALRARFEATQERLAHAYARTRNKVVAGAHYADDSIREHPYQSLALAAGVGVLIGLLLSRNRQ